MAWSMKYRSFQMRIFTLTAWPALETVRRVDEFAHGPSKSAKILDFRKMALSHPREPSGRQSSIEEILPAAPLALTADGDHN
jgi:hypothetical protein